MKKTSMAFSAGIFTIVLILSGCSKKSSDQASKVTGQENSIEKNESIDSIDETTGSDESFDVEDIPSSEEELAPSEDLNEEETKSTEESSEEELTEGQRLIRKLRKALDENDLDKVMRTWEQLQELGNSALTQSDRDEIRDMQDSMDKLMGY